MHLVFRHPILIYRLPFFTKFFKAALENMTKNCAIQYIPEKIRVNAVAPTAIDNDLLKVKGLSKPDRLKITSVFKNFQ